MQEQESLRPLSASQMEMLEEAVARYQAAVTRPVAAYLKARGIDRDTATTSRLGVVSDPAPGHERFKGFLAIPYLNKDGAPLSVRFRCMEEHTHRDFGHGKYMSLPDEPARLYGIASIFRAGEEIHLAEGELDGIILNKVGLPAVALPGAHSWSPRHRVMLSGFNRIWVWGDPDDAGADLIRKVTRSMPRAKVVQLRDGDVTDTYKAGGAEALLDLITERSV